jgi:hypothetical protein
MPDLLVFAAASKCDRCLPLLQRQLYEAGIDFYLHAYPRYSTWAQVSAPQTLLDNLDLVLSLGYEKIVMVDAFDVLFFGTKEELAAKVTDRVTFCADRNLVPSELGEENFPVTGTPWRFLNGGAVAGTGDALAEFREYMGRLPQDAGETGNTALNRALMQGTTRFGIDSDTRLFYNTYLDAGELTCREGRPFNRLAGTFPSFLHLAGGARPEPFLERFGIDFTVTPATWLREADVVVKGRP